MVSCPYPQSLLKTVVPLLLLLAPPATAEIAQGAELSVLTELDLKQPLGQLRAVPVELGEGRPKAVAALYGEDAEIDPYIGMFFFPKSTLRLILFDESGDVLWRRDLGPGVVPGVWFSPVFAFDMTQDGVDEIYIVNNKDPEHPLDHRQYVLEQLSAADGRTTGRWPWPQPHAPASMSHTYRHFLAGGMVEDKPVLVAIQGTYGPHAVHAFGINMKPLWQIQFDPETEGGPLGSHITPVVDIDQDGADDLFLGERCLSLRNGKQLFCCDHVAWRGHSDIIQPVLDRQTQRWFLWTCRETSPSTPPRLVMFDQRGSRVWADVENGHMDTGWAARLGPGGEPLVLGAKVGQKARTAEGERRTGVVEYTYDAFSGRPAKLGFNVYTTIPVDLNGDGVHELVKGYFEGDGTVMDRSGKVLGNIDGLAAMCCQFTGKPGEQILSYRRDGKVRIWYDPTASDTPAAKARYSSRFYQNNRKLTGVGYNLFLLGGI